MSKRTHILIVTAANGKTDRMTLADFVAAHPNLANDAKAVLKTGGTRAVGGMWIARGVA